MNNILQSYLPLNTKEKIDQLISNLQTIPGAMNLSIRQEIFLKIERAKIQSYFNEKYPESIFNDTPSKSISNSFIAKQPIDKQAQKPGTSSNTNQMISLPSDSLGSRKYIYGTYVEMAFHNFFLNMRHIYKMVFGEDIMEVAKQNFIPKEPGQKWDEDFAHETLVWNPMFLKFRHALPEEALKIEELINRHFPMLEAFTDFTKNSRGYKELTSIDILECFSQSMRILRHVFSHYKIELFRNQVDAYEKNEDLIAGCLNHAFLGSKRIVTTRFAFTDDDMHCTERFRYGLTERQSSHLSIFGLAFLASLFLEKKYSKILTDKLRCIPQKDQPVVTELIAVYRARLTNEKFHVTKDTDALALDILTELRRCPKELFEILRPEDQERFRIHGTDETGSDDVLMMRHRDRFPHLVMKYIDDAKLFDTIRFQVSLGKYFFKFYDKYCIDNASEARVRSLSKNINGFGRISEVEGARNALWDEYIRKYDDIHKNTREENPYITDHHPQYVINGNRIAMHIFKQSPNLYLPELTTEGASNISPSCWMSTYELPAMAFLIHLKNASFVEEIIKSCVANYRKLFADVANGILLPVENEELLSTVLSEKYGDIQLKDIPKDIYDYLIGNIHPYSDHFTSYAKSLIDKLIEQTRYKKERFLEQRNLAGNAKQNKLGKKSYIRIQPGKLASFLAKDIMYFQPNDTENKNKLTSLNFRILQSVLALYCDGNTDTLKRTLQSAHIIGMKDDAMCNPVVMRVMQRRILPGNIMDFYEAYLDERLAYLQLCKNSDIRELPFIHADRMRWQKHDEDFYKAKAGRYLQFSTGDAEKPIELPRGLFDKYIRQELAGMEKMRQLANDNGKNMSYLIYGYFKNIMLDDLMPIYDAPRTYALLNALYRKSPHRPKVYYSTQQIRDALMRKSMHSFQKDIQEYVKTQRDNERQVEADRMARLLRDLKENETTLKRYKIQDIMLFLIAKRLLMEDEHDKERIAALNNIHLRDITDKSALSQKIRFAVTITSANGKNKTIRQDDLKLKDYAKFYRFLNDRRLPSLLDLVGASTIDKQIIDEELSGYDKVHPTILENVLDCERHYIEKNGDENIKEIKFANIIKQDDKYSDSEKEQLKRTRNSFAHSVYPKYWHLSVEAREQHIPHKAITISEGFVETLKKNDK